MRFKMRQLKFKLLWIPTGILMVGLTVSQLSNSSSGQMELSSQQSRHITPEMLEAAHRLAVSVATQAQNLNKAQEALSPQEHSVEEDSVKCRGESCITRVQDIKFTDQCTSRNSDLEKRIEAMKLKSPLFRSLTKFHPEGAQYIKPNCVKSFMENFPLSGLYRNCQPNTALSKQPAPRPCITEPYVNLVSNSFNLAATCLPHISHAAIQTAAKVFPHESGFHINAMRPGAYDSGVGQLISISIRDVNKNGLSDIISDLSNSKAAACRAIHNELLKKNPPLTDSNSRACERLNVEKGNPLLNVIYAFSLLQIKQQRLDKMIWNQSQTQASLRGLSQKDQNRLKEAVLTWAYNIGESVAAPVKEVINTYYRGRPITNIDEFIARVKRRVKDYSGSTRANYRDNVINKFEAINRTIGGGQCFQIP